MIEKNDIIGFENTYLIVDSHNEDRMIFDDNGQLIISTIKGEQFYGKWKINNNGELIIGFNGEIFKFVSNKKDGKKIYCTKKYKNKKENKTVLKILTIDNKEPEITTIKKDSTYRLVSLFLGVVVGLAIILLTSLTPFLKEMHFIQKSIIAFIFVGYFMNKFNKLWETMVSKIIFKHEKKIKDIFFN